MTGQERAASSDEQRSVALATDDCTVTVELLSTSATVTITGEVDLANADEVLTILEALLDERPTVDVDLADLEFIDSYGVSRMVIAQQAALQRGATLRLLRPRAGTRRVFLISGLIAYLNVE